MTDLELKCERCGLAGPSTIFAVIYESWVCPGCGADESAIVQTNKWLTMGLLILLYLLMLTTIILALTGVLG